MGIFRLSATWAIVATCLVLGAALPVHAGLVAVGNAGNTQDNTGYGAVSYDYQISATLVTNAEYATFLNAVAKTDANGLYNTSMSNQFGGIERTGSPGSYVYTATSGRENNPVVYVSFWDTLRYVNWLHNGMPNTGVQDSTTTEDGAYTLNTTNQANNSVTRNSGATWILPTENEWYKAAYYDPTLNSDLGGYWDYATQSDSAPTAGSPPGSSNSANFNNVVGNSTPVGAYEDSQSYYGTYDQSGNVWEWNEAIYSTNFRGIRGGAWFGNSSDLSSTAWIVNNPTNEVSNVGFRVASLSSSAEVVPEPGSLAVWSLIGVSGLCYRRRKRK